MNSIIHRDYNYSGSILISLYDNHLEINSLGGLIKGLTIEDLYKGVSQTRNKFLANIFYRLGYVESFGTGIKRIIQSYEEFDKKPIIQSTENVFQVILYNVNYKNENKQDTITNLSKKEKIIQYLKINKTITRKEIEKLLDISSTRAKEIIADMLKEKSIKKVGNGRNVNYILK